MAEALLEAYRTGTHEAASPHFRPAGSRIAASSHATNDRGRPTCRHGGNVAR
jgi:hypothetical protein